MAGREEGGRYVLEEVVGRNDGVDRDGRAWPYNSEDEEEDGVGIEGGGCWGGISDGEASKLL